MRYDATSHAIEATGLVKWFGKTTALDGVDLVARQGRVLGVLGPNGAGKSVTELRPFIGAGARSLGRREIGLGPRRGVPLPGDCLACLPAGLTVIGRRGCAAGPLPSDTVMT